MILFVLFKHLKVEEEFVNIDVMKSKPTLSKKKHK